MLFPLMSSNPYVTWRLLRWQCWDLFSDLMPCHEGELYLLSSCELSELVRYKQWGGLCLIPNVWFTAEQLFYECSWELCIGQYTGNLPSSLFSVWEICVFMYHFTGLTLLQLIWAAAICIVWSPPFLCPIYLHIAILPLQDICGRSNYSGFSI